MSKLHYILPTVNPANNVTVRMGASSDAADRLSKLDEGKLVKLAGESRYTLAVAGDPIEAVIVAVDEATAGGFSIGAINDQDRFYATADGLQATPGTGTIAVGDYVVAGAITAKGTALAKYPKVCKATVQPGAVPADLTAAGAQIKASMFAWRVESIRSESANAAVGTTIVVARVNKA